MPWVKNKNGEDVYKPSMFMKEELPTWHEFYNEWYKKKLFHYTNDDSEIDHYWKVPKTYWLIARCCNQLNKMLWEGHGNPSIPIHNEIRNVVEKYIHEYFDPNINVYNIAFCIAPGVSGWYEAPFEDSNKEIRFAYSLPKISESPFYRTSDIPRVMCERELGSSQRMLLVVGSDNVMYNFSLIADDYSDDRFCCTNDDGELVPCSLLILDTMMEEYKKYFENGVGWKDDSGNIIKESGDNNDILSCISGFDPAL